MIPQHAVTTYIAKGVYSLFIILGISNFCFSQEKELSWEELREHFECPAWFAEARFGIWAHWGAQTEPELGGGWYARHMYQQDVGKQQWGKNAYPYHCKTYGHPSEVGYKGRHQRMESRKPGY